MQTTLTHVGTATMLVEFGWRTFLTDPVFDPATAEYVLGPLVLRGATESAISAGKLPIFDAVRSRVAHLDGDRTAASTVALTLPAAAGCSASLASMSSCSATPLEGFCS